MGLLFVFACCIFMVMLIPVSLFILTFIYRWSCVLCGLPRPTVVVAAGIMFVTWVSLVMAVGVLELIVREICSTAKVPQWEARIIVFLLALPLDLTISAGIESGLMNVRFGKGVEMWYTQRLIQLTILAVIGFIAGIVLLIRHFA